MTLIRLSLLIVVIACAGFLATSCAKSAHQTGQDQLERLVPADVLSRRTIPSPSANSTPILANMWAGR